MIRQPFSFKRKSLPSTIGLLLLLLLSILVVGAVLLLSTSSSSTTTTPSSSSTTIFAHAEEIVATKEWQLLGENDTVDAGMHIRMDLQTGQKWVKLPDDDDNDKKGGEKNEGTASTSSTTASSESSSTAAAVAVSADGEQQEVLGDENDPSEQQQQQQEEKTDYDYDMIHRTLSKLPDDDKEAMGLPELPVPKEGETTNAVTPEQRAAFEAKLKQIWEARQQELMKFQQESVADLPQVLRERIERLSDYIKDPITELQDIDENDYLYYEDDDMTQSSAHILWVLQDLEFQLNDMDMTRDFHTLGGWSLLVSLLADNGHPTTNMLALMKANTTASKTAKDSSSSEQQQEQELLLLSNRIHSVQSHVAWALGTAVKNSQEFADYVIEPIVLSGRATHQTTALDVLLEQIQSLNLQQIPLSSSSSDRTGNTIGNDERPQKYMYALGSFLRGNRAAQRYFVTTTDVDGPKTLSQLLVSAIQCLSSTSSSSSEGSKQSARAAASARKLIKRLLTLADDIVTDVRLHESEDNNAEEFLDDESIIKAFTSSEWCMAPLSILQQGDEAASDLYETVLKTMQILMPYCKEDRYQAGKAAAAADLQDSVKLVKAKWLQEEKEMAQGDDEYEEIDPDIHRERMELVENVLLQIMAEE